MSIRLMTAVFDRYPGGGGEMLLALALADHSSDDGSDIYPSVAMLATKTRQSERTVQYQLRRMEESGWLILVNSGNGGRSQRREYRISSDWIKGADIAPLEKGATDDVNGAIHNTKGASDDTKGCNPLHPHITVIEPSMNHQEPSVPEKRKSTASRRTRIPADFAVSDRVKDWAVRNGYQHLHIHLDHFAGYARAKGVTYADWDEALMNAIRGNWAKVPAHPTAQPTYQRPGKFDPSAFVNQNRKRNPPDDRDYIDV